MKRFEDSDPGDCNDRQQAGGLDFGQILNPHGEVVGTYWVWYMKQDGYLRLARYHNGDITVRIDDYAPPL